MKLLNKYLNGNVTVTLFDDGTKIQEWNDNEEPNFTYPTSLDIKITNYCDLKCEFCHEMSTILGKHADLEDLLDILQQLPSGTELAFGGGNPLSHPGLIPFLTTCKSLGLVSNLTVNYLHIVLQYPLINKLIDEKLIYGLGISIPDDFNEGIINLINKTDNCVYHVIAGVNDIEVLDKIKNSIIKKVLILGYKSHGRGKKYLSDDVLTNLNNWKNNIGKYIKKVHLSFDNLSINQLEINLHLSQEEWDKYYMGNDGLCTMYIDAVKQEFSISSIGVVRFPLCQSITECFDKVKELAKSE